MNQRRILLIAGSIVVAILVGLHASADQKLTDEVDRRDASLDAILARKMADRGLTPCGYIQQHNFAEFQNQMFPPSYKDRGIKILFLPSFAPYHGVALGTNSVESVSLQGTPTPADPVPKSNAPSFRKISPELSYRVYKSIVREIRYAATVREEMSDGEGIVFLQGDTCAYTWSPQEPSRAATLSDLARALTEGTDETRIDELLKRLETKQAK